MMWLKNDGTEFENTDWYLDNRRSLAAFVYQEDRSYIMICNANASEDVWRLPAFCKNAEVEIVLDSTDTLSGNYIKPNEELTVPAWSVIVLEIRKPE